MNYNGPERRKVERDWIERDRLLTKLDSKTDQILIAVEKQNGSFKQHVVEDNLNFKTLKKRIFWLTISMVIVIMTIGGPELVAKLIK